MPLCFLFARAVHALLTITHSTEFKWEDDHSVIGLLAVVKDAPNDSQLYNRNEAVFLPVGYSIYFSLSLLSFSVFLFGRTGKVTRYITGALLPRSTDWWGGTGRVITRTSNMTPAPSLLAVSCSLSLVLVETSVLVVVVPKFLFILYLILALLATFISFSFFLLPLSAARRTSLKRYSFSFRVCIRAFL